jgi:osmotically-inducible protein OsmY
MEKGSLRSTKIVAAAALFLAAVGAGGCGSSAYARRTADDARLSALIEQRLTAAAGLSRTNVQARSHRGVVALLGEVPEEQLKQNAGQLAVGVPGVVRVNNLIVVVKGDSQAEGSPLPADSLLIARTP